MEYHPEFDMPTAEAQSAEKFRKALAQADTDMAIARMDVNTFLMANELVWGWREPNGPYDLSCLRYAAVTTHMVGLDLNRLGDIQYLLDTLRSPPQQKPVSTAQYPILSSGKTKKKKKKTKRDRKKQAAKKASRSFGSPTDPFNMGILNGYGG